MTTRVQAKAIVRAYAAAFSAGDWNTLLPLFSPDAQIQGVLGFGTLDLALSIWRELHTAFNPQLAIEDLIAGADDDRMLVAARFNESGTFTAPFRGLAPTGKSYTVTAMEFFEIRSDRITRRWGARDSAAIFRQLESPLPPPPAPPQ